MGAPRKPTGVLERSGALKKDPKVGRERANEPVVLDPLGPPPADFPFPETWAELREESGPDDELSENPVSRDRPSLAANCGQAPDLVLPEVRFPKERAPQAELAFMLAV